MVDYRSRATIDRQIAEVREQREIAANFRQTADEYRRRANETRLQEEDCDVRATAADNHAAALRTSRDGQQEIFDLQQQRIDGFIQEMWDCERSIDAYRDRVRNQQEVIRDRRAEAERLNNESIQAKRLADSNALQGLARREQGRGGQSMLEEAEIKQREGLRKEKEANDLEGLAQDGERNIHRLCDQMLEKGRERAIAENARENGQRELLRLGNELDAAQAEVNRWRALGISLREEEKHYEDLEREASNNAEKAEKLAENAEKEAASLERRIFS